MKGNGIERDTLDGVITALERVDDTWQNVRNSLQYPDLRDALHYLQVLQKMQKAQPLEKSEWDELYNQPLTWDELKTMEGKPVWVEVYDPIDEKTGWHTASWKLIEFINDEYFVVRDSDGGEECFYKSENDSYCWQAYRKERK